MYCTVLSDKHRARETIAKRNSEWKRLTEIWERNANQKMNCPLGLLLEHVFFNVWQQLQSSVIWLKQPVILHYFFIRVEKWSCEGGLKVFQKSPRLIFFMTHSIIFVELTGYLSNISSHINLILSDEYMLAVTKVSSFNQYSKFTSWKLFLLCSTAFQHSKRFEWVSKFCTLEGNFTNGLLGGCTTPKTSWVPQQEHLMLFKMTPMRTCVFVRLRNKCICIHFCPPPWCVWRSDPATVNITDEMSKGSFGNVWKSVSPAESTKKEPSTKRLASLSTSLSDIQISITYTSQGFNTKNNVEIYWFQILNVFLQGQKITISRVIVC